MKLYTEEVLRNSMNSVKYYMEHYDASVIDSIIDKHIKALGPIELPSDDDAGVIALNIASTLNDKLDSKEEALFIAGFQTYSKWIKEQNNGK